MVSKKNIILKLFILLKFFLLLGSCTYKYNNEYKSDIEDVKKIKLNVKSFEISKGNLDIITTENLLQNEINKKVLNKFESWVWQKFATEGIENKAFLNLLKVNTIVKEERKNKKLILSFINQGKKVYKIALNFDLSVTTNDNIMKTLKITSSQDFQLLNRYSIDQRNKVIIYNVNKLIKLIDEKVTLQLNKKAFNKFVIM